MLEESGVLHERQSSKGGLKIEIVKKLILVILPFSIFLCLWLASFETVSNEKGVYKVTAFE